MKYQIENKINQIDVTLSVEEKFHTEMSSIQALEDGFTALRSIRSGIDDALEVHLAVITGIATNKKLSKLALVEHGMLVSEAISSYGHSIGDQELKESMMFSRSKLKRCRDEALVGIVLVILAKATEYSTQLVDYGVDAAEITALETANTDFKKRIPKPKEARDSRKECTAKLDLLCKEASVLQKNVLDKLVDRLPDSYAEAKAAYKNSCMIIDNRGKRKKAAKLAGMGILLGTVNNSEDSGVIEDATIMIVELNMSVTTDEDGTYYFEQVPAGVYTLKVSAATYVSETIPNVEIVKDSEVTLDVALNSDEG